MQLAAGEFFRIREAVEMTFTVRQLPVRVAGFVRRSDPHQIIGVEFSSLSRSGKRHLRELIEELAEVLDRGEVPVADNP